MISELGITRGILEEGTQDFLDSLNLDVAIAGAGPSGLMAGKYLAQEGVKVAIFERKLSVGGGMWGGGMLFPKIVVQEEAKFMLDELGIKSRKKGEQWVAGSIEAVSKITSHVIDSGVKIFNGISVEDVIIRKNKVGGVVINWSFLGNLHVDPLAVKAKFVVDATGHEAEICQTFQRKVQNLKTPSGKVEGESSMWSEKSEKMVVENTKEVYPGLLVTGMAANAVFNAPRMGPIFGGMFLSGKKAAEIILEEIK